MVILLLKATPSSRAQSNGICVVMSMQHIVYACGMCVCVCVWCVCSVCVCVYVHVVCVVCVCLCVCCLEAVQFIFWGCAHRLLVQ